MDKDRQDFDNVVWDRNDEAWEDDQKQARRTSFCHLVESVVEQKFGKHATLVSPLHIGGYNVLYRIHVEGVSNDVMVRLPCPSQAQFPTEKTPLEAATTRYLQQNTLLPVSKLFYHGQDPEIGPFIIIEYICSKWTMSDALTVPNEDPDTTHILNPSIPEATLENFYSKMAFCILQLSQPSFPCIGSLVETSKGKYSVTQRPITLNMNNMIQLANIPPAVLPKEDKIYKTASEWYIVLAEMHIAQLIFQHNDLVTTGDDCRNKYVARQLFRRLAKQGRLSTFGFAEDNWSAQSKIRHSTLSVAPAENGSFRLWCDDLRPGNVLLNELDDIVAIIDWEFAYVAPTQFILDPPWWLLLDLLEMWSPNIDDWARIYDMRLKTWLSAMRKAEESMGFNPTPFKLSTYMKESWETGRFWLSYAARKSWAFDTIYWKFLDERFFGKRETDGLKDDLWKTRVHLLGEKERIAMDSFVERKMEESKERIIVEWDPIEAKERFSELLFD